MYYSQFNGKEPLLSFVVSTLSWSEELCLFLSIFSLYLQCSSYNGKKKVYRSVFLHLLSVTSFCLYPFHFFPITFNHHITEVR